MRRKRRLRLRWNKKSEESSSSSDGESVVYGKAPGNSVPPEDGRSAHSLPLAPSSPVSASAVRDVLKRQIYFQRATQVLPKWAIESDLMTTFPTFHLISVASGSPVGVRKCSSDGQIRRNSKPGGTDFEDESEESSTSEDYLTETKERTCESDYPDGLLNLTPGTSGDCENASSNGSDWLEKGLYPANSDSESSSCDSHHRDASDTMEGSDTVEETNVGDVLDNGKSRRYKRQHKDKQKVVVEERVPADSLPANTHRKVVAQHSDASTAMLLDLIHELEGHLDSDGPSVVAYDDPSSLAMGSRISQSWEAFAAMGGAGGVCLNLTRRGKASRRFESKSMDNVNVDCPDWRNHNSIGDLSDLMADISKMFNRKNGIGDPEEEDPWGLEMLDGEDAEFWKYIDALNMNPLRDHRFRSSRTTRMFLSNPNLFTFAVSLSDLDALECDPEPEMEVQASEFQLGIEDPDERIGLEIPLELMAGKGDSVLPGGTRQPNMDSSTCLELALEGERLCKAGDCRAGVAFFEAAIQTGTDDLRTLSAIYSQLGNAYFYLGEYDKAMEYHKLDLTVARTMGDRLGVAKASGNLGNTLKVMGKFKEAICCCERHLSISQELEDKVGEGRALYNLGNVYHAQGKHLGRIGPQEPGGFSEEVKHCLQKAVEYYAANLRLMEELNDRSAQGRACGNLGNTHYLLGNFTQAISYHNERLAIAKEFGDKAAERRAHSNLGNAHIFLGEFETAADHYKKTLQLAQELGDRAVEAQACYSLGNTYTLLRDYPMAIHYHLRHLAIAQELTDKVGEGRACWSLGNAYSATNNHEKALQYANRHLEISKEIGDKTGQAAAQMNLADIRKALGLPPTPVDADSTETADDAKSRTRRKSMENMDLLKMTPDAKGVLRKYQSEDAGIHSFSSDASHPVNGPPFSLSPAADKNTSVNEEASLDEDSFFELLSKFQSKRMDDQRCTLTIDSRENQHQPVRPQLPPHREAGSLSSTGSTNGTATPSDNGASNCGVLEELMESIAGMQSRRMDEQRASLPQLPGLNNQHALLQRLSVAATDSTSLPDDNFFDMLMRCQGSRIEDQRSCLPNEGAITHSAPTVPDDDFFSLIVRFQSGRLEDQRSTMPLEASHNSIVHATNTDEEEPPPNSSQNVAGKDGLVSRLVKGRK